MFAHGLGSVRVDNWEYLATWLAAPYAQGDIFEQKPEVSEKMELKMREWWEAGVDCSQSVGHGIELAV